MTETEKPRGVARIPTTQIRRKTAAETINELAAAAAAPRPGSFTLTSYTEGQLAAIPPAVNAAVRKERKYAGKVTLPEFWAAIEPSGAGELGTVAVWQRHYLLDRASLAALRTAASALMHLKPKELEGLYERMAPHRRDELRAMSLAFYPAIVAFLAANTEQTP